MVEFKKRSLQISIVEFSLRPFSFLEAESMYWRKVEYVKENQLDFFVEMVESMSEN